MNKTYKALVLVEDCNRLESMLNNFQVGLNDWGKTEAFDRNGKTVVKYFIRCEEVVFNIIVNAMRGFN